MTKIISIEGDIDKHKIEQLKMELTSAKINGEKRVEIHVYSKEELRSVIEKLRDVFINNIYLTIKLYVHNSSS
ncbi:MAG: hypothetical protein ACP5GU_05090 [Thermoprotei archaeon]|jgi:hypothetical protein